MTEKILNLGIVAHADAGKTTLTEQILYRAGAIRAAGSVDQGTASTDGMAIERQRGISVRTACASVLWRGVRLNLIDAPGHADFLSEVQRSLAVLDAAVLVVSAVEGVQPQTRLLLEAVHRARLPCFLFFNKLDRAGSHWRQALAQAEKEAGGACLPLCQVSGEGEAGVAASFVDGVSPAWVEQAVLACGDDQLLENFLDKGAPSGLGGALKARIAQGELYPVLCGATKFGLGVDLLLDALAELLPQPAPLGGELCARVYKVEQDPALGKAAYVRLFAGKLGNRQEVTVCRQETESGELIQKKEENSLERTGPEDDCSENSQKAQLKNYGMRQAAQEKTTRVRRVEGRRLEDAERIGENQIGVVYGLGSVRAGDLLGRPLPGMRAYHLTEPLMLSKVTALDPAQQPLLNEALRQLEDEDPLLQCGWNQEKREVWARLTGRLQVEVLEALLRERWGVDASFSEPSVIYKETPAGVGEGFESYTWPKPCWAEVRFLVEPLPRGSGFQYECRVSPGRLPYRYQAHVETAVPRALEQGLKGWQVTDLKVTLVDGTHHHVHTHPLDFFVATPMGVMNALQSCGTKLLEPVLRAEFSGPEDCLGKALGLISNRRASFSAPQVEAGRFRFEAEIPAAEAMDLPVEFAAATGGRGVYGSRFSHYADCPDGMGVDRERMGVDPLDRPRFILAARQALAGE